MRLTEKIEFDDYRKAVNQPTCWVENKKCNECTYLPMCNLVNKLLDTIETQRKEISELKYSKETAENLIEKYVKEIDNNDKQIQQLQAQNGAMRAALRHGVDLADGLYATSEFVRWAHDDAEPALSSEAGRNYHNPADVEALKLAREALML